jgi:hypothetical protein
MTTAHCTTQRAHYAEYLSEPVILAKIDGAITIVTPRHEPLMLYSPDMAPDLIVLGALDLAETQRLLDTLRGGAAKIACTRRQEVA